MQLTINDIAIAVQLIDVVTARGAFRGDELSQVGAVRDKFAGAVKAAQEAEAPAADQEAVDNAPAVE
jgi:hypothetical protein